MQSKKQFFDETLSRFLKGSPQKFWRDFRNRKAKIEEIVTGSETLTATADIAEHSVFFFRSVFSSDTNTKLGEHLGYVTRYPMEELAITREGVFQLLLNLDEKKSSGPDEISPEILKRYAEWTSHYLTIIFQKSLHTHSFPQGWRSLVLTGIQRR